MFIVAHGTAHEANILFYPFFVISGMYLIYIHGHMQIFFFSL